MKDFSHYPPSPSNVPADLTKATASYKRHAWFAMLGLLGFIVIYLALALCFAFIAYNNILIIQSGESALSHFIIASMSVLLTIFMFKSFFTVRKSGTPGGIEITADTDPKLFQFLHQLADEIGAPKPYKVFVTPDVNAAVFYDLSLLNLIFPTRKNLIIGLGLVNVLNLGELKAVLAHEFGHFAQGSMAVGRWVYIAQQIIAHMVATRDWLDSVVRFISRIDIRIAWLGWILALIIWSIRSLMDTLFSLVVLAERALSREMEFNADLVAVSITGSDALVHALHKLQAADQAWQTTLEVASREAHQGKRIKDLFNAQKEAVKTIGSILNDDTYGVTPKLSDDDKSQHRVFSEQTAKPPQMWSTHPANRDREDNAKSRYIFADIDKRSSWLIFSKPEELRHAISMSFYNSDKTKDMEVIEAEDAVGQKFNRLSYASRYRGTYLSRSTMRSFSSVEEILQISNLDENINLGDIELYPDSISQQLDIARSLESEQHTLEALASGELKPSGGVIRHRGKELKREEISDAIEQVKSENKIVADRLKVHDANCRVAHLNTANKLDPQWHAYLWELIKLQHCVEHLRAVVSNERALLFNTWQVITADGQVGYFEKRRILNVCQQVHAKMDSVSESVSQIQLPQSLIERIGLEDWAKQRPVFDIAPADKKNWPNWCETASHLMESFSFVLGILETTTLEELLSSEAKIERCQQDSQPLESAPTTGKSPRQYPVLLPGNEHILQRKLDLWNRFQLAHGVIPTTLRLVVSLGIVGGTVSAGLLGITI